MDNSKLLINQVIRRINEAAKNNSGLTLSIDDVKILAEEIGDQYFIPVLTNEQILQLVKEGKLGQSMIPDNNKI